MRKPRWTCIWRAEQAPDSSAPTPDDRQTDEPIGCEEDSVVHLAPELTCVHKKDPAACPICSRDWTQPQTGQLPYRPKAA
jgi:hypothetical protein